MQIGIVSGQLVVKNNGGFDKMLAMGAKGGARPHARADARQLTAMESGMPGPTTNAGAAQRYAKGIVAALKSYIASPGTLTVRMQPAQPINAMNGGMGAMMDRWPPPRHTSRSKRPP